MHQEECIVHSASMPRVKLLAKTQRFSWSSLICEGIYSLHGAVNYLLDCLHRTAKILLIQRPKTGLLLNSSANSRRRRRSALLSYLFMA
jgi:hypothetical protein